MIDHSMDCKTVIEIIQCKFAKEGKTIKVPLQRGRSFQAKLREDGVEVSNLSTQPFLPWAVFEETIKLLQENGGRAERGDAMSGKLGDHKLPLNSIEGHIAHIVYGKKEGDTVFRRISPVAAILVWAGLCEYRPGALVLRQLQL